MAGVQSHGRARGSTWTWRPVARDVLLARAFHSCTELEGRFYLVGGLLEGGARVPSNETVIFDPARGQAVRLLAQGSPLRSHHDAALVGGRWLCVVGGWDGSRRLSTVAALDTLSGVWEVWTAKPANCPPAGLSSHTCTRISDRELRVSGREGGTRTQRRYGSIYTLKLDHSTRTYWYSNFDPNVRLFSLYSRKAKPKQTYWESIHSTFHLGSYNFQDGLTLSAPSLIFSFTRALWQRTTLVSFQKTKLRPEFLCTNSYKEEGCHTASRSGHCAALLTTAGPHTGHQLLLFGGCNSFGPEVAGQWSPGKIKEEAPVAPRLTEQLAKLVSSGQGFQQGPQSLRHHSCSVVGPFAVLFGGETLTRARDTICNDLYIYDTRRSPPLWFHFPCTDRGLKRVGHRTCLWNDQLYLVGGFGEDGRTASPQVCMLEFFI